MTQEPQNGTEPTEKVTGQPKSAPTTIQLDPDILEKVNAVAHTSGQSVNQVIEELLKASLPDAPQDEPPARLDELEARVHEFKGQRLEVLGARYTDASEALRTWFGMVQRYPEGHRLRLSAEERLKAAAQVLLDTMTP